MKNLSRIRTSFLHYENIANSKRLQRRNRLNNLRRVIRRHYNNYHQNASNNNWNRFRPVNFNDNNKRALIHCYDSKCQALDELKAEIREAQDEIGKILCQYCTVRTPGTFDHYLSKMIYPEFSVLSFNLIPCCHECNEKKGERLLSSGERLFINLYYDRITHYKYLYCLINYRNNVPVIEYRIKRNHNIPAQDFLVIRNHYEKLELLTLFRDHSNVVISTAKLNLKTHGNGKSNRQIKNELLTLANEQKKIYGNNYWKALLHEALAKNDNFINSLEL